MDNQDSRILRASNSAIEFIEKLQFRLREPSIFECTGPKKLEISTRNGKQLELAHLICGDISATQSNGQTFSGLCTKTHFIETEMEHFIASTNDHVNELDLKFDTFIENCHENVSELESKIERYIRLQELDNSEMTHIDNKLDAFAMECEVNAANFEQLEKKFEELSDENENKISKSLLNAEIKLRNDYDQLKSNYQDLQEVTTNLLKLVSKMDFALDELQIKVGIDSKKISELENRFNESSESLTELKNLSKKLVWCVEDEITQ